MDVATKIDRRCHYAEERNDVATYKFPQYADTKTNSHRRSQCGYSSDCSQAGGVGFLQALSVE